MGSLLEMMFVLLGSAILTVQGIRLDIEKDRATMLALEGQNEATVVTAFQGWISDNFGTILTQYTASGNNPSITPPTIAQLVTAGNLKQIHKSGPYWGGVRNHDDDGADWLHAERWKLPRILHDVPDDATAQGRKG